MSKYIHLISTQSPIEMDQILFSLQHEGIDCRSVGANALAAGNAELSGINGGSVEVLSDQYDKAQKVLKGIGLGSKENKSDNSIMRYGLIAIGVLLTFLILRALIAY